LEDSANGVRSALGAGVPTIVTEAQYTRGEDFTGALAVLPDLGPATLAALRRIHATSQSIKPSLS
jgi:beta-phosphoglucomutase-like phosphatase (HAD superfamily)